MRRCGAERTRTMAVWVAGSVLAAVSAAQTHGAHSRQDGGTGADTEASAPERILREICDPHNGLCWVVIGNPEHPAGPGRMVLSESGRDAGRGRGNEEGAGRVVIQAGDRVLVEEHTPAADARLEAVALGAARAGSELQVRLKIAGKVVRAVAVAPGRAALAGVTEGRR